jgi:hypothetical protein
MGDWHGFERRRRNVSAITSFWVLVYRRDVIGCVYETYSVL